MRLKPKVLPAVLAAQIAAAAAAPAGAAEPLAFEQAQTIVFNLPINGQIGAPTLETGDTVYKVWPPADLGPTPDFSLLASNTPDAVPPAATVDALVAADGQPIIIDNDAEEAALVEDFNWQEIPDQEGKTKIQAGARFPIVITSELTSKTARKGDPVEGRLKVDIKIGGKLVARKGDLVVGHVATADKARRILVAELSPHRWWRANGSIGLQFDEIVTADGEHLPLLAAPARKSRIVKNSHEGRVLGVNHNGEVATPLSIQLKHQALHLAIRGAASAGGVFSFGIVPVAYGVAGAINPSFAFLHPVGTNVPHRRLKGFAMGVVSGVPGGFLIADTIIKGQEAVIKPGDEFLAEFRQDFTGEAATDAQLLPGARTKVHGEVLPAEGKSGNKK